MGADERLEGARSWGAGWAGNGGRSRAVGSTRPHTSDDVVLSPQSFFLCALRASAVNVPRSFSSSLSPLVSEFLIPFLAAAWVSGFLSGSIGFASGVVPAVLLTLFAPASTAIPPLTPVLFVGAVVALLECWGQWDRHRVVLITLPLFVGTWFGTEFLATAPDSLVRRLLGAFVVVSAIPELLDTFRDREPSSEDHWLRRLAGSTTGGLTLGFLGGITSAIAHAGGIVVTIHLASRRLDKHTFTATVLAILVLADLAKLATFSQTGLLSRTMIGPVAAALPFVLVGVYLGRRAHDRIPTRRFHQLVAATLVVVGVVLVAI